MRELGGDEPRPGASGAQTDQLQERPDPAGPPPWRRRAAVGVVIVLFLGVAYMLTAGRPQSATTAHGQGPASAPPVELAARAALDAWARFASTGDLDQLRDTFDPAGPQLARLTSEAPALRSRPLTDDPYTFSATVLSVGAGPNRDEQLVAADVVVSRPGETDQRFAWELVLRRSGGSWLLWTVNDRAPTHSSATTGGAP